MYASDNGHIEVVRELINRGADINAMTIKSWDIYDAGSTALDIARIENHQDIVRIIQKKEQEIESLINACSEGHIEIVKELTEKGADINAKDKDKRRRIKDIQH